MCINYCLLLRYENILPCISLSNSFEPVVTMRSSFRRVWNSVAVVNPIGTSLKDSLSTLSAFASLIPFIASRAFFGV